MNKENTVQNASNAPVRPDPSRLSETSERRPLVVDLDGTLCRTDTLHEGIFGLLARSPLSVSAFPGWVIGGKAAFKRNIADRSILDPAFLPYDDDVIRFVEAARAEGRPVVLVSAADHRQVEAVAEHLKLFDMAIGTGSPDTPENLRGAAKERLLVRLYGEKGFDYLGDSITDIPIWSSADTSYAARVSPATRRAAAAAGLHLTEVSGGSGWPLRALVRACRPHQWAKNLLILLPVLASQDLAPLPFALLAMLSFSLAASAIYIVNDLVDLPADRAHPRKRHRPFAAGTATAVQGIIMAGGLLLVALATAALLLPPAFLLVLLLYLATTSAYSFWLKRKMMVDVVVLAMLYTLRIVAGGLATDIALSPWLLVFSMFLFFALATIKRQAELEDLAVRGNSKTLGRNLILDDLPILQAMSVGAAQAAVLVFALYSQDPEVQGHFASPDLLLLICPVLLFWLGRMQLLTRRGYMNDDPIVFTFRDRTSLLCGVLMLGLFILAAQIAT